ncbi:CHASE3 domain-containing protein [Pontibacter sp. BT310]|uniref:histidine kinase n=1 Tax=Pontibacter populi TaxID=890055 RepID=A0ABS6XF08_9BACT|nr:MULTISPECIES: CHASE3 domain-containing protein [Pontibacter]MBJ6119623.1 CHASE3 domain-containing protein [Pontibacter sp. BT310]MBR0572050.1 CHASE3 domain-containing protein [Microvirga sp. STS03]MBW3366476.1 CHASE3 domain-containing protein [Pontibacter populi]
MLELQKLLSTAKENRRLFTGIISGLFIFFSLIFGISYNLKRESEISRWVLQSQEEIYQIEKTISLMKDYETSSRGYLLTGKDSYVKPLKDAAKSLDVVISRLKTMASNNEIQKRNLDSLTFYLEKKADFSAKIIRLKRQQGHEAAMQLFRTNIGMKYMDMIRQHADIMHAHARAELAQQKKESKVAVLITNRFLTVGVFFFGVLLLYAIWKSLQQEKEKRVAATQRKAAELRLKESEKNMQAILSSSQEAIYLLDLNYRLVLLNDHNHTILKEAYGTDSKPGDDFRNYIDAKDRDKTLALFDQVLNGQKIELERTFRLADGDAYYLSTYFPVKDTDGTIIGICCASKNITQRKLSEEAVRIANAEKEEYQSRFKAILDYSPQAVLIKDTQGEHIFSNKAFHQLFALEDNQQPNYSLKPVLDDAPVLAEFLATYEPDGVSNLNSKEWQQQVVLQNGQVLEMEIIKFPLYDRKKQLFGVCTLFKDITEQIKHQQQLVEARENAEQAERLQEQFLANMSHELRTPMNGIIGMVNLLLTSSSLQPDQKGRLQVIKHSSDTLLNLINDILDLSKIKAGMLTIEKLTFDFNDTIAATAMLFREKAREKGIKLAVSADPFIPRFLTGDPHRLNQILNNLLSNAVKFTEKGFVRLEASLLSETEDQAVVEFIVSDSGIGIDTDKLDTIFDNFTQESTDISSKYGGTGLGLAITKRLIELQGGEITVESVKDKGTAFTFTINYDIAHDTSNVVVTSSQVDTEPVKKYYSGKRALIVEDNEINQTVLTSSLNQYKMDSVVANNGQEAVDMLQAGEQFDIIFMDLRMPVMNGFQATAYIRQTLQNHTPIVVLTASVLRNERERCLEIGASDYMAKPFSINDLAKTLERFIAVSADSPTIATPATPTTSNPAEKPYSISNLTELKNPDYIKRILALFTNNVPLYLQELKDLANSNNRIEFLEKAHKIKGSLSAIQIKELYQLILLMEEEAPNQANLNVFEPQIDKSLALCAALMPAITSDVEAYLSLSEAN